MQGVSTAHSQALVHAVFEALEAPSPVLLSGSNGSGKTHALRTISVVLSKRNIPNQYIDATSRDAAVRLEAAPPDAVLLFDDYTLASLDVLHVASQLLVTGTKFIGAAAENTFDSDYNDHLGELYTAIPALQDQLNGARTLRLELHTADEIARLVHRHSKTALDAVTVAAIQQLSWGRPGWALDVLQLLHNDSLAHAPRPHITRVRPEDLKLASLRDATAITDARLEADDIAAAVVLAEIGPRSWNSVADIFGAAAASRLADAGLLLLSPGENGLYGVPELYAAATKRLTDPEKLAHARRSAAEHLLGQELFGIPLPDAEAIFCGRVLSNRDRDPTAPAAHDAQRAQFTRRLISDLVAFGEAAPARDLLLRLGQHGPGLSPLERARLTTVLRDAHTGLQAIMTAEPPRANFDLPSPDPSMRFALLLLRGRLAAETGIPPECDPDIGADDTVWLDAQLVVHRWNDTARDALEGATVARSMIRFFAARFPSQAQYYDRSTDHLPGAARHRIWSTHLHAAHRSDLR